jgi:CelD/BcsL family acetyltransferase involved in cellulose biosynthesis
LPSFEQPEVGISSTASALTFRLVTDFTELQSLTPAWEELWQHSANPEPMQSPSWLLTWWSIYGQDSSRCLRVGLFYDRDQLVGMAPLCRRRHWHRPGIPFTRLEFLGADGESPDGVCSEYLNVIARAGHEDRVVPAFVEALAHGSFGDWHELVLDAMKGDEPMPDRLLHAFQAAGFAGEKQTVGEAPYLLLPESWEAYLKSLSANKRRYLLVALREFEAWAGTDWQIEWAKTPEALDKGQAILHALHNHRWQEGEGMAGAFSRPRFLAFHQSYMPRLLQEGRLELFWINVRGEPIAVYYQLRVNGKISMYQSGRRLDVPASVRPGIIIAIHAIQHALAAGCREFDFLAGLAQYKLQFTKTTRPLVQVRIAQPGPREWLRCSAAYAVNWARRARNAWRQWRCRRSGTTLAEKSVK